MKQVAKVLIHDREHQLVLLLRLNNHPAFGNDPDLPGGIVDAGETPKMAAIREVYEEVGIILDESKVVLRMKDVTTSTHGTERYLYEAQLDSAPQVTLSWEHESYSWVNREELVVLARSARDTYMHMVSDVVNGDSRA